MRTKDSKCCLLYHFICHCLRYGVSKGLVVDPLVNKPMCSGEEINQLLIQITNCLLSYLFTAENRMLWQITILFQLRNLNNLKLYSLFNEVLNWRESTHMDVVTFGRASNRRLVSQAVSFTLALLHCVLYSKLAYFLFVWLFQYFIFVRKKPCKVPR